MKAEQQKHLKHLKHPKHRSFDQICSHFSQSKFQIGIALKATRKNKRRRTTA
ncbi:MAG: hypothetical protein Q4E41_06725 [Bacteroidales bacterium]|nr:hypothetical protein [Bacteroidales bacterium]